MDRTVKNTLALILLSVISFGAMSQPAIDDNETDHNSIAHVTALASPATPAVLRSYRRRLPLTGGSNFRDIGGYPTEDGRQVKRGLLFRSGAMTSLTQDDMQYLDQFGFRSVVDLRSNDEIDLYPNSWAAQANLNYVSVDYDIREMNIGASSQPSAAGDYSGMYLQFPQFLKPQLTAYFDTLLSKKVPAVVNCSAGQDRTGIASALLLSALGVERDIIVEDYLLSTDFRDPQLEQGDVDLEAAAKTNAFAAMILKYSQGKSDNRPNPLTTHTGTPFIDYAFSAIEQRYGSVENYLAVELGVDAEDRETLRTLYLQ